jgi:hypothetical protein
MKKEEKLVMMIFFQHSFIVSLYSKLDTETRCRMEMLLFAYITLLQRNL